MTRKGIMTTMAAIAALTAATATTMRLPKMDIEGLMREDSVRTANERRAPSAYRTSAERETPTGYRLGLSYDVEQTLETSSDETTTETGEKVRTYDIESENALSLSVYFSQYHLTKGDTLYIISDEGGILGPYTEKENLKSGVLPTPLIEGKKIRIALKTNGKENTDRRLKIGKVSQSYRDFRRLPYQNSTTEDNCSAYNMGAFSAEAQAVCLIIFQKGSSMNACSGVMMNNTNEDGRPYLLTAAHCVETDDEANTTVVYFNYQSPLGNSAIRGSMEFYSVAPTLRAYASDIDFSLLELPSKPERDFMPYMAGWNIGSAPQKPYYGIHHPNGTVKRLTNTALPLTTVTYTAEGKTLHANGHWKVERWNSGTTEGGSSGSPLFDYSHRVIGALTGGSSTCTSKTSDYYYKLNTAWDTYEESGRQLKAWLDPKNTNATAIDGRSPYGTEAAERLTNIKPSDTFTNEFNAQAVGAERVAQQFKTEEESYLYGVYVVSSTGALPTTVYVYNDLNGSPIYTHTVTTPKTAEWSTSGKNFMYKDKTGLKNADTYIRFDTPIEVGTTFHVAYDTDGTFVPYASTASDATSAAYAEIGGTWMTLTEAGLSENVVWIDAVTSTNGSRTKIDEKTDEGKGKTRIYPNPVKKSSGEVTIYMTDAKDEMCDVSIYGSNGQRMAKTQARVTNGKIEMKIGNLPSGLYAVEAVTDEERNVYKLIVEE